MIETIDVENRIKALDTLKRIDRNLRAMMRAVKKTHSRTDRRFEYLKQKARIELYEDLIRQYNENDLKRILFIYHEYNISEAMEDLQK